MSLNLRSILPCLAALLMTFSLIAQPANDNCADAIAIGTVTDYDFTTVGATTDGPYHPGFCSGGIADSLYNDIWYLYTADFTGTAEFTTCGTADFDTNIAVYEPGSPCPPTEDNLLACNEDGTGCAGYTSETTFDVTTGQTYLLRLGGWGNGSPGEEGTGTFTIQEFDPPVGPANDECVNAIALDLGPEDSVKVNFTTVDATTSDPYHQTGPAGCLEAGEPVPYNDIWYKWTATFTGYVEYSNCGMANFDSKIAVYGPNQSCPPEVESLLACGDDGCAGFTSLVSFPVEKDSTYLLRMGSWSSSDAGFGSFTVKRIPPPVPPANDQCVAYDSAWITPAANADEFDPVFSSFTSNGTSSPTVPVVSCMAGNEYSDVWYKFNSGTNTDIQLRIARITPNAEFYIDLLDNCGNWTDPTNGPGFCFYTDGNPDDLITVDLSNFPGVPTEYYLRVATDLTYDSPGEFFLQLLGDPYTGTDELFVENFMFYPNPASGLLNIQFETQQADALDIQLLNTLGQVVFTKNYGQLNAGRHHLQVPVNELKPGIYFFRMQMEEGQKTVRFVKK